MGEAIEFSVANRAVSHLGRQLYGTVPPALAEIIANSYDAYATFVDIHHHVESDFGECLVIADNGIGMNFTRLRTDYAKIGHEKVRMEPPEGRSYRAPMGRKGIGKLAAFSIGDEYRVYTRVEGDALWKTFSLPYKELLESEDRYSAECNEVSLPSVLHEYEEWASGCIVVISSLRHGVAKRTWDALESRLARRFYLVSGKDDFVLRINDSIVDLSRHEYYGDLDTVVYFGYEKDNIVDLLGCKPARLERVDESSLSDRDDVSVFQELVRNQGCAGWIGFVNHPSDLHVNVGENYSNIVVYINGKIADDDLLRNYPDSTFASKYLVGEIVADYLQNTSEEAVTSSRQGLDNDNDSVRDLIQLVRSVRARGISVWNDENKTTGIAKLPEDIRENSKYVQWVNGLNERETALNNSIIRGVRILIDSGCSDAGQEENVVRSLVNGSIEMVELIKRVGLRDDIASALEEGDSVRSLALLISLLHRINASESYSIGQVSKERLSALCMLEKLMDCPETPEKDFQRLIAENVWIVNPTWRSLPSSEGDTFKARREAFYKTKVDGSIQRNFIDIFVTFDDGFRRWCAIVELKRNGVTSYSDVDAEAIQSQIKRYRRAIAASDPQDLDTANHEPDGSDIPAYFIIPSDSGISGSANRLQFTDEDKRVFKARNITVKAYKTLIDECRRRMRDEMEICIDTNSRPFFGPLS